MGAVQPPARPGGFVQAESADMTASVTPRRSARIAAATGAASFRTVTPRRSARVASAVTHASRGVPDSAASARGPRRGGPASVPRRPLRVKALAPGRVDPRMRTRASRLTPAVHVSETAADVELNEDGSRVYPNSRGKGGRSSASAPSGAVRAAPSTPSEADQAGWDNQHALPSIPATPWPLEFLDLSSSPESTAGTAGPVAPIAMTTRKRTAESMAATDRPARKRLALSTAATVPRGGASMTGYRRKRASSPPTRHV